MSVPDAVICGSRCAALWLVGLMLIGGVMPDADAQPVSGSGLLETYQKDVSCAAAADAWLSTISVESQDRHEAAAILAFFADRSRMSGKAAGFAPEKVASTIEAFKAWSLPGLTSKNPAKADAARTAIAAAARQCAAMPGLPSEVGQPSQH